MFTEGILIDSKSKRWKENSIYDVAGSIDEDEQLLAIECQPRDRPFSKVELPDEMFPNSILIVREGVMDMIYSKMKSIIGGHKFPSRATLVILKETDDPYLIKQMKRDMSMNPIEVSNRRELRVVIKSHLTSMDPEGKDGVSNIREFEKEVCEITNSTYNIVPDEYKEDGDG